MNGLRALRLQLTDNSRPPEQDFVLFPKKIVIRGIFCSWELLRRSVTESIHSAKQQSLVFSILPLLKNKCKISSAAAHL